MVLPAAIPASYDTCLRCNRAWRRGCASSCVCVKTVGALSSVPAPMGAAPKRRKPTCLFGHAHDSQGEATACAMVYRRASDLGLVTFRPGRPGVPCFRVAPDDDGRPCYVSVDWVLVNAAGKVVVVVDYKGSVPMSERFRGASDWSRAKRIIESETGARVVELAKPEDALTLTVGETT